MAIASLSILDQYAANGFPPDFPDDQRTFFAPVDDVHAVLKTVVASASESLVVCMYGFDDQELADIIRKKCEDPAIAVILTFDSSQAGGVHERALLEQEDYPATIVAVGRSERGAIMHQKIAVVDGSVTVTGSTNWSDGGEAKQDNQLTVHLSRSFAARCRARADAIHSHMLATAKKTS